MVTNLKRSKKIRAFCYRMIAVAALITAIGSAVLGREALVNAAQCGWSYGVLSGDLYYSVEFRQYVGRLYNNAMIGHAGIGDDLGHPLTDQYATEYAKQALAEFYAMIEETRGDILYYIAVEGQAEQTNFTYPIFSEYDGHLMLPEDVMLCWLWDGNAETWKFYNHYRAGGYLPAQLYNDARYKPNKEAAADMQIVIAVKEECHAPVLKRMEHRVQQYSIALITCLISIIAFLLFGFMSLFSGRAARVAKEEYAKVSVKLWLEVKLLVAIAAVYLGCWYNLEGFSFSFNTRMKTFDMLWLYFPISCLLYLLYVDIRQSGRRAFENSLPVKVFRYVREAAQAVSWYRKTMVFCAILLIGACAMIGVGIYMIAISGDYAYSVLRQSMMNCGLTLIPFGVCSLLGFFYLRGFLKDANAVMLKMSKMRQGKGKGPLKLPKHSLLRGAAEDLNELEAGIEKAVEEQSRSHKMKVELITNVSHDLKTPLTSIINYADLLCEEELPQAAADYAVALQRKAYRLKTMVQDVFDLSKATSGNLSVEKAVIDMAKLIKQTLADMDEKIQESNLIFKLNISKEPLPIEADGEKLYRVFQNLFVNALQYSLEHSRVHVQLTEENGFAVARVKNTSRMELDFDTTEIMERFVRADSSRTTEGSGLGLSIVQSFAEACGGEFTIETDADMFIACIRFPLVKQRLQPGNESE